MIGSSPVLLSLPSETIHSFDQLLASPPRMRPQSDGNMTDSMLKNGIDTSPSKHQLDHQQMHQLDQDQQQKFPNPTHLKQRNAMQQQQQQSPPQSNGLEQPVEELILEPELAKVSLIADAEAIPSHIVNSVIKTALGIETDQEAELVSCDTSDGGCVATFASTEARDKAVLAMRLHGQLPYARAADVASVFRNRPRIIAIDCHSWVRSGKCTWDQICPFRHPPPVARVPCRHWFRNRGECWYGEHCNFLHPGTAVWVEKGANDNNGNSDRDDGDQQQQQQQQQQQHDQSPQQQQGGHQKGHQKGHHKQKGQHHNNHHNHNNHHTNNNSQQQHHNQHQHQHQHQPPQHQHQHQRQHQHHHHKDQPARSHSGEPQGNNNNNNGMNNNHNNHNHNNSMNNGSDPNSPNTLNLDSLDLMNDAVVVRMPSNPWSQNRRLPPTTPINVNTTENNNGVNNNNNNNNNTTNGNGNNLNSNPNNLNNLENNQHSSLSSYDSGNSNHMQHGANSNNNTMHHQTTAVSNPSSISGGPWQVSQSAPETFNSHVRSSSLGGVGPLGLERPFSSANDEIVHTMQPRSAPWPMLLGCPEITSGSTESVDSIGVVGRKKKSCLSCAEAARTVALIPCGHLTLCDDCGSNPLIDMCGQCNSKVVGTLRIHF